MKSIDPLFRLCLATMALLSAGPFRAASAGPAAPPTFAELTEGFLHPGGQARARACYAIPRGGWDLESLTQDLQYMQEMGFGGLWYLDGYEGHGPVHGNLSHFGDKEGEDFMSPAHLRKLNQYLEEADRRGLQIIPPIRALWLTGGPWVTADLAAKEYTLTKTRVRGAGHQRIKLPAPSRRRDYYRDAFVVAWPAPASGTNATQRLHPRVTVTPAVSGKESGYLTDGNGLSEMNRFGASTLAFGPLLEKAEETVATFEFPTAIKADACFIRLSGDKLSQPMPGTILASTDGVTFRKLADFKLLIGASATIGLSGEEARWFRVVFPPLLNRETQGVGEIEFLEAGEHPVTAEKIRNFELKAARTCWDESLAVDPEKYYGAGVFFERNPARPDFAVINPGDVRVLKAVPDADDCIEWDVPEGNWCVMRLGYTLARNVYAYARRGGAGFESDIYNPDAARVQYENVPQRVLNALSPAGRRGLQGFWFESFELGPTNWTQRMADEFEAYAGYNPASWLPVLADEVVGGLDQSDAFLADFRRTLHHLYAEKFQGELRRMFERDGLQWHCETGYTRQAHQDDLAYLGRASVPSGEFWGGQEQVGYPNSITEFQGNALKWGDTLEFEGAHQWWESNNWTKLPASASHTFGRSQRVAVEALTGSDFTFHRVPAFDKHVSDRAYLAGANQFYVSWWFNDPRKGVFPGLHNWGWLNPRNPIFRESAEFFHYLSRCQSLLQQGKFKGDVVIGLETALHLTQRTGSQTDPKVFVPKGYDFDFLDGELLLQDLRVEEGSLTLSSGMKYRVLQIPDFATRMSVECLRKIESLLEAGAVVLAPKPETGITGRDYLDGLKQHRELVARLWSGLDGTGGAGKAIGKGRLYWGTPLAEVLQREHVRPDFAYTNAGAPAYIEHIHRRIEETGIDLYFLANAVDQPAEIVARFRDQGKKTPHLFDPLNGTVSPILNYRSLAGGDLEVPLAFDRVASLFVVFTEDTPGPHVVSVEGDRGLRLGRGAGGSLWAEARANGHYRLVDDRGRSATLRVENVPASVALDGAWRVDFADKFGARFSREFPRLGSFADSSDPAVKYFSGEATYRRQVVMPATSDTHWYLELGEVRWLAEVKINGKEAGTVWCPPWRLDVTPYCRPGENTIEIVCANPWKNRIIGDAQLPENERKARFNNFRATFAQFKDAPLMPAGLLGPIRLEAAVRSEVKF